MAVHVFDLVNIGPSQRRLRTVLGIASLPWAPPPPRC
jgi:hypothetical protein